MRTLLFVFLCGCGDNGGNTFRLPDLSGSGQEPDLSGTGSALDLSQPTVDLSSLPPDFSGSSNPDLTGFGPIDLSAAPALACGGIFQCVFGGTGKTASQCAAGHPAAAIGAYNAIFECINNSCGNQSSDAGSDMPCDGSMTDMGIAACNTCFYDSMTGGEINWTLPGGGSNTCTTTTDKWCGACVTPLDNCLNQCFTDSDCAGFTTPLTCMGASGTTPGTCG
jgi:hypothetical protein